MAQAATPTKIDVTFKSSDIDDMRELSRRGKLPSQPPIPLPDSDSWGPGIDLSYLQDLRQILEERLTADELNNKIGSSRFDHYTIRLGETDDASSDADAFSLHFIHAKSERKDAIPLLLLHGWPGSVYDFHKVIPKLVKPDNEGLAFHVVVPSLPGYFLSGHPQRQGWTVINTANVFNRLMVNILGYEKYAVQGGDWGSSIGRVLAAHHSTNATFVHINLAFPSPGFDPSKINLSELEKEGLEKSGKFRTVGRGYFELQNTKPFTIGYALSASPLALLAYIGEKIHDWSDTVTATTSLDELKVDTVNTIALYYLSSCAASAAWIYHESAAIILASGSELKAKSKFGYTHYRYELAVCPKEALPELAETVDYYAEYERGGHFPALDVPDIFVDDLQKCFKGF